MNSLYTCKAVWRKKQVVVLDYHVEEMNRLTQKPLGVIFSERELTFTFAICCRRSVCLSVVCLSVTFVHPTQPVEIFRNFSSPFGTLAIH